ncbi:hypothetical protein HOC35_05845 [Candidatus Woesearchaeota archaeon]|jgi:hypothetical protein|nr:hypothetical protein [Candidatus Woesearchaeota archaeon]
MTKTKKQFKNKKSMVAYFQLMMVMFRIFVLGLVLFSIAFMVFLFIEKDTNIQNEEVELFVEQLLYSKNGLSYRNQDTGRVYPGIINFADIVDPNEIEKRLNKAFDFGDYPLITSNFSLTFPDHIQDTDLEQLKMFYYNKKSFEEYLVVSGWTSGSQQNAIRVEKAINVVLRKENVENGMLKVVNYPATLHMTVLSPKS